MPWYINNTDVALGWGRGVTRSPYCTPHWGSLCRCWGHTLSASLFWLSLHAPIPLQILLYVCVRGLECNAEVPQTKPVSLTKHFFFACSSGLSETPWQPCSFPWSSPSGCRPPDPDFFGLFHSALLSNLITIMYIRVLLLLLIVAGCYNEFSAVSHNGRHSCLRGYRHLLRKNNKNWGAMSRLLLLVTVVHS